MTKLISLALQNYRPFYKKEKITFSTDSKKNFNVLYAGTGGGKTSILDSIAWCLYGEEIHKPQPIDTMLNDKRRDELKTKEPDDVIVEVILGESEDNISYVFHRKLSFMKNSDGTAKALPHTEEFKAKIKDERNNLIDAPDPNVAVRWVFPKDIQHLFMFDGEKLQTFFDEDNVENTREAIIDITQIDFLKAAIDHLKSVSRCFKTDNDTENPQIEEYTSSLEALKRENDNLIVERQEASEALDEAKKNYGSAMERLQKIDRKDLKKLLQDEKDALEGLEKFQNELDGARLESFKHLLESVPLLFCKKELKHAVDIIDKKYESGELPPDIKVDFVEKLLKKQICICKTSLKPGSKARKFVEEYKSKAPLSKYEEEIRHGQSEIKSLLKSTSDFIERRKKLYQELNKINDQITAYNKQLQAIEKDKKGMDEKEIESLMSKKDFEFSEIGRYNRKLGEIQKSLDENEKKKNLWEGKKRKLEMDSIKNSELREKFSMCDTAITFLQDIKEKLIIEIKRDIETETDKIFRDGVIEPRVSNVCITDDFECQVLDKNKQNIYRTLSTGQKQILAISFMIALRKDSGFDSPILIDYPFGRIDIGSTDELIQALKEVLKEVQVNFFLIEGKEFTEEVKQRMDDRIGKLYEIKKLKNEARSLVTCKK